MALRKAHNAQALQAVSERVQEAAEVLKALSSDTRLKIMCVLSAGELPVNKLAEFTDQSQSAVS